MGKLLQKAKCWNHAILTWCLTGRKRNNLNNFLANFINSPLPYRAWHYEWQFNRSVSCKRRSKEQERFNCHSKRHALYYPNGRFPVWGNHFSFSICRFLSDFSQKLKFLFKPIKNCKFLYARITMSTFVSFNFKKKIKGYQNPYSSYDFISYLRFDNYLPRLILMNNFNVKGCLQLIK